LIRGIKKRRLFFENGVWGVAPSGVRAAAPYSATAWMPCVYAQGLCKDAKPTKHTQSFTMGKGFGIGIENKHFLKKTNYFYKLPQNFCGCFFSPHYLKSRQKNDIIVKVYRQTLMSVGWK